MTKQKEESLGLEILGILFLIVTLIITGLYFSNVSIGNWIARDNYTDKGEWLKQIGLFIATMSGFYWFIKTGLDFCDFLPKRKKT